jgi:hypothetical protein
METANQRNIETKDLSIGKGNTTIEQKFFLRLDLISEINFNWNELSIEKGVKIYIGNVLTFFKSERKEQEGSILKSYHNCGIKFDIRIKESKKNGLIMN